MQHLDATLDFTSSVCGVKVSCLSSDSSDSNEDRLKQGEPYFSPFIVHDMTVAFIALA